MNETKEMKEKLVKQYEIFVHNMLRIATKEAPHITTSFIKEGDSAFSTVDMAVVVFGFDKKYLDQVQVMLEAVEEYWETDLLVLFSSGMVPFRCIPEEEVASRGFNPAQTVYFSLVRPFEFPEDIYLSEKTDEMAAKFFFQVMKAA